MIVVRQVFQAKYGHADELVALFREFFQRAKDAQIDLGLGRILTDLSGQFFTIVTENEVESLAEWERVFSQSMARQDFGDWFSRMQALVESGRRDFYTIQARLGGTS